MANREGLKAGTTGFSRGQAAPGPRFEAQGLAPQKVSPRISPCLQRGGGPGWNGQPGPPGGGPGGPPPGGPNRGR